MRLHLYALIALLSAAGALNADDHGPSPTPAPIHVGGPPQTWSGSKVIAPAPIAQHHAGQHHVAQHHISDALPLPAGDCCNSCKSHGRLWGKHRHGVATVWHPAGDMHPSVHHESWPKTYYYFRPYNMHHVARQRAEGVSFGAPAGQPYSNAMFKDVYRSIELSISEEVPAGELDEPGLGEDRE